MISVPNCLSCKHFIESFPTPPGEEATWMRCLAFDRIPAEIVNNQFDHRKPYPGDRGIRFEPQEDTPELSWPTD